MLATRAGEKDLFEGVNEPADPSNLSDLERMHLPVIQAPATVTQGRPFEVAIEVGELLPHPSEPHHFIQFVELWVDATFLARIDLTADRSLPKVRLRILLRHPAQELRARARCNLHGVWMARKRISVERLTP